MKVQLGIQLLENDKAGEIPLLFNNTFNLKKLSKNFDIMKNIVQYSFHIYIEKYANVIFRAVGQYNFAKDEQ